MKKSYLKITKLFFMVVMINFIALAVFVSNNITKAETVNVESINTTENRIWTHEMSTLETGNGLVSISGMEISPHNDVVKKYNTNIRGYAGSYGGFASEDYGFILSDLSQPGEVVFTSSEAARFFEIEVYIKKSLITATGNDGVVLDEDLPLNLFTVQFADESQEGWNDVDLEAVVLRQTVTFDGNDYVKATVSNINPLKGAYSFKIDVAIDSEIILDNFTIYRFAVERVLFGYTMEGPMENDKGAIIEPAKGGNEWTGANHLPEYAATNDDGLIASNNIAYNGHRLNEDNARLELYKRFTNNGTNGTGYFEQLNPELSTDGYVILRQRSGINFISIDTLSQTGQITDHLRNFIKVYTSSDGVTFSDTAVELDVIDKGAQFITTAVDGSTQPNYKRYEYFNNEPLPEGTTYIKVVIQQVQNNDNQRAWNTMIDTVKTFETGPYEVSITGDDMVGSNQDLALQANIYPSHMALTNVEWVIDTERTTAEGAEITVDSEDASKASVKATGGGEVYVRAISNGVESELFVVNVVHVVPVNNINISHPDVVYARRDVVIKATVLPSTAEIETVEWEIVDGNATIEAYNYPESHLPNELFAIFRAEDTDPVTIKITVNGFEKEIVIIPTDIIDVDNITIEGAPLYAGLGTRLIAVVTPEDATLNRVTWSMVDAGNTGATITQDGVVRANTPGVIVIRAVADEVVVEHTITVHPYRYEIALDFEPHETLTADPNTTSGFYSSSGNLKYEVDGDNQIVTSWSASGFNLVFYQENGFNGFAIRAFVLQEGAHNWPVTRDESKNYIQVYYSFDGINYELSETTVLPSDVLWKNNAKWMQFIWMNNEPILGNPTYLKMVVVPESENRAYNPLIDNVQLLRTEANDDPFHIVSRRPVEDGVTKIGVGTDLQLFVKEFNYKNIEWTVDRNGATISNNGLFTATEAGTYIVTAKINNFESQEFIIEAIASHVVELNVNGNKTINNGGTINFTVECIDQYDSAFTPENFSWVLRQGVKGDGSIEFTQVTGNTLNISQAIPNNYNGTLILEITAGDKTEEITITVNKVRVLDRVELEGGNEFNGRTNIELTIRIYDQYGVEIESLNSIYWRISGQGFTQIDGRTINIDLDLTDSSFSGELNLEVNVKMTALDPLTTLNETITINAVGTDDKKDSGKKSSCFNILNFSVSGIAMLGIAGIVTIKKKKQD